VNAMTYSEDSYDDEVLFNKLYKMVFNASTDYADKGTGTAWIDTSHCNSSSPTLSLSKDQKSIDLSHKVESLKEKSCYSSILPSIENAVLQTSSSIVTDLECHKKNICVSKANDDNRITKTDIFTRQSKQGLPIHDNANEFSDGVIPLNSSLLFSSCNESCRIRTGDFGICTPTDSSTFVMVPTDKKNEAICSPSMLTNRILTAKFLPRLDSEDRNKKCKNAALFHQNQSDLGKASNVKDAPSDPLRPLSAYNYFFRDERERIIKGGVHYTSNHVTNDFSYSPKHLELLLHEHWSHDRTTKRRHRKTHGKISFTALSKLVSQRWKALSEEQKEFYQFVASKDWSRYQMELDQCKIQALTSKITASA
jgi:HMG (high mobility group) box